MRHLLTAVILLLAFSDANASEHSSQALQLPPAPSSGIFEYQCSLPTQHGGELILTIYEPTRAQLTFVATLELKTSLGGNVLATEYVNEFSNEETQSFGFQSADMKLEFTNAGPFMTYQSAFGQNVYGHATCGKFGEPVHTKSVSLSADLNPPVCHLPCHTRTCC
jgi:hypothetical protein